MAIRAHVPLPGTFAVSLGGGRTAWKHADCNASHHTRIEAEQHAQWLATRTPAQRFRRQRLNAILTLVAVGIFVATFLIAIGVAIFVR